MGKINTARWLAGGIAAGVLMWLAEGLASQLYLADMQTALAAHNLEYTMTAMAVVTSVAASLIAGLTLVWLYAAARPRFGPGPRTAVMVAVAMWGGGYLLSLLGYRMLGLFPDSLLAQWAAVGLVEMVAAANLGGWIYRET